MVCSGYSGASLYVEEPVVVDENLITATGLAPLEFFREVFRTLNVMEEDILEAWYRLYETKDSKYFYSLMDSLK